MLKKAEIEAIRLSIAAIPADVSNDAVGANVPKLGDMFAPATHAAALDPSTPIVVGARGAGKSFWSGVLGQDATRAAAATAYPNLGLHDVKVGFGFTGGIGGAAGISTEMLNGLVGPRTSSEDAKAFWWAAILRACSRQLSSTALTLKDAFKIAHDWEQREALLDKYERDCLIQQKSILVIFDALDTVATTWVRRRALTEALLEVVWALRAYKAIKPKLFLRPDQIDDDALRFVELPKLRTGAVRLTWTGTDLYGLLFSRLLLTENEVQSKAFLRLVKGCGVSPARREEVLARQWPLTLSSVQQAEVMSVMAGPFMAEGVNGHKKGRTYDWPIKHLADAFDEVTPRSFLGLMIAAAKFSGVVTERVVTPEGIRHGLRAASKTRVDQLHQEFLWIKGVLAPLAGLLLPQAEGEVFKAWKKTRTLETVSKDAAANHYLPPFESKTPSERDLYVALEKIGVMFSRKDGRLDMPDLFRVAAKLLKKGGTAPS